MADRHSRLFPEGMKDEEVLEIAGALAVLTSNPAWKLWEQYVYDAREETREEMEACEVQDIPRLQGAANAFTNILKAPGRIADHARDLQDRIAESGDIKDTVRVPHYPDGDPVS